MPSFREYWKAVFFESVSQWDRAEKMSALILVAIGAIAGLIVGKQQEAIASAGGGMGTGLFSGLSLRCCF